jgi:hypothetical protein
MRKRGTFVPTIKSNTRPHFTPEMDAVLISGGIPNGVSLEMATKRLSWLKENFIDVGWGSDVGKRTIYWD